MSDGYSIGGHTPDELAEPGFQYTLTPAGLAMLTEIWNANPTLDEHGEAEGIELKALRSYRNRRNRRSWGEVFSYLLRAGYVGIEEIDTPGSDPSIGDYNIIGCWLGRKAIAALREHRVIVDMKKSE